MGVNSKDGTELGVALLMGNDTIVVCMLGTETPAACFPERILLFDMIGA